MKKIVLLLVLLAGFLSVNSTAKAATEVNTVAELKNAIENASADIAVRLGSSFPKDESFEIDIRHPHIITIDGASRKLKSKIKINMYDPGDSTLEREKLILLAFHFDGEKKYDVGFELQRMQESETDRSKAITIASSIFENSTGTVLYSYPEVQDGGEYVSGIDVRNSTIRNNESKMGGAVIGKDYTSLTVRQSILENNVNKSNEWGGGAVSMLGIQTSITFDDSKILNNKLTGKALPGKKLAGGAVYVENVIHAFTRVSRSLVSGNKTNPDDNQSGGAIYVGRTTMNKWHIKSVVFYESTFANNESSGAGGAIAVDNTGSDMATIHIDDSLFYSNIARGNGEEEGGGAVSLKYENPQTEVREFRIQDTTFYNNKAENKTGLAKGGALKVENYDVNLELKTTVFGKNEGLDNYKNVFSNVGSIDPTDSIGFDNGKAPSIKDEDVFGKYPIPLTENRGKYLIGTSGEKSVLPSISLMPRFTDDDDQITTGWGDPAIFTGPNEYNSTDLRDYLTTHLTIGSVKNASILYDANEGVFNLPQLTEFAGLEYYEGTTPTQYGALWLPGKGARVVDGQKDLNIKRAGYTFAGWSTEKNGELTTGKQPGNSFTSQGQTKLFAVWKANKYQSKYFGNGHTAGVAPKMTAVTYEATEKVKDENTLKRTGYTFLGWSEKATASKADPTLKPGMDYKVGLKNNFYAIWQRDSNEVKYAANNATSGTAPKSAKVLYGNSVKLKNAGTLKRKGYTFTGWSTNKKATKAQYKVGKALKITKPTTLYAVWKKK